MLRLLLARIVRRGNLVVIGPGGRRFVVGDGSGDQIVVQVRDRRTELKLALHPDLYLGEAYMDGALRMERGSIRDLLEVCSLNVGLQTPPRHWVWRAINAAQRSIHQINAPARARKNAVHHYDLDADFYRSFLDADMQYSCAYFCEGCERLEDAQLAKKAHVAAKLALRPGMRVLDIGCGWGGLALYLAEQANVTVLGISLSEEQIRVCRSRAKEAGLGDRVRFEVMDYRDVAGPFDRIVSVGMFEHVGTPNYRCFFTTVRALLAPSGAALVHSIGRSAGPYYTSSWIRRHIFPGGYAPAVSEVIPCIERAGLWLTDLEVLRLHYAETLRQWRNRFLAENVWHQAKLDARWIRMWDFYLAICEMSFRYGGFMVFQAQLANSVDALPITRDYMTRDETKRAQNIAKVASVARQLNGRTLSRCERLDQLETNG